MSCEDEGGFALRDCGRGRGRGKLHENYWPPVYDWFTEGFETADLQDAKTLLGELG